MKSYVMTGMNQPRLSCPYPTGKCHRIIHILMSMMIRLITEGILHQHLYAFKQSHILISHLLHIRNIGQ